MSAAQNRLLFKIYSILKKNRIDGEVTGGFVHKDYISGRYFQ